MKLVQLQLPSQGVLLLIAGIIHGRPVLDVSLTLLPPESTPCNAGHGRRNLVYLFWIKDPLQNEGFSSLNEHKNEVLLTIVMHIYF